MYLRHRWNNPPVKFGGLQVGKVLSKGETNRPGKNYRKGLLESLTLNQRIVYLSIYWIDYSRTRDSVCCPGQNGFLRFPTVTEERLAGFEAAVAANRRPESYNVQFDSIYRNGCYIFNHILASSGKPTQNDLTH